MTQPMHFAGFGPGSLFWPPAALVTWRRLQARWRRLDTPELFAARCRRCPSPPLVHICRSRHAAEAALEAGLRQLLQAGQRKGRGW